MFDLLSPSIGLRHTLRLGAFTGVAVNNIGGSTLHKLLEIGVGGKKKSSSNLESSMMNVETLLIDEISMIGSSLFQTVQVSCAKVKNKPNELFGGMSVIVCGDFYQLPPTSNDPLYRPPEMSGPVNQANRDSHSKEPLTLRLQGYTTWNRMLTDAIFLKTQYRMAQDPEYYQFVSRYRHGESTQSDLDYLEERRIVPSNSSSSGHISMLKKDPLVIV